MSDGRKGKAASKKKDSETPVSLTPAEGNHKEVEKTYVFKSKYRDDHVRLKPPTILTNARGEKTVFAAVYADFNRHTWSTKDDELAAILRDKIKEREPVDPLGVQETTDL